MHYRYASSSNNVYSSGGGSNSRSSRSRAPPPAPRSTVTLENILQYENRGGPGSRGYTNSAGRSANVRTASNMNAGGGGGLGRSNSGWRDPLPPPPPPPQPSHHHHQYHHHHHGPPLLMDNSPGWGSNACGGTYEGQSSQFIDPSQPSQGDPISSQNSLGGAGNAPPPPSAAAPPPHLTRHHSSASNSSTNIDIMVTAKRQERVLDSLSSLLREVSLIKDQLGSGTGPSAAAAASATLASASASASASLTLDAEQSQDLFEKASQTMNTKIPETERDLTALKDDMSRVDEKASTIGRLVESLETRLDKNLDELKQQMKQIKDQLQEQSSVSNAIEEMKQVVASLSEELVKSRTTMKTLEAKTSFLLLETTSSSSPKGKQQQQQQQQQENCVMKTATPPPAAATTTPKKTMTSAVGHQPEEEEGQEQDPFIGMDVDETLGELSPDMLAGYEESLDFPRSRTPSPAPTSTRVAIHSPAMTMSYDEYIAKRQQQLTAPLKPFSISAATAAGSNTNTNRKVSALSARPIKSTAPAAASARNSSACGRKALPRTLERRMTRQQSNSQRGGSSMKQHTQEEQEESEGQQQVYDEYDFDRNEGKPLVVEAPRRRNQQQQASSLKRRRQG